MGPDHPDACRGCSWGCWKGTRLGIWSQGVQSAAPPPSHAHACIPIFRLSSKLSSEEASSEGLRRAKAKLERELAAAQEAARAELEAARQQSDAALQRARAEQVSTPGHGCIYMIKHASACCRVWPSSRVAHSTYTPPLPMLF
jgi:hypothetical protein